MTLPTTAARLPQYLLEYIRQGNPVRNSTDDPLAGRCGADKARRVGPSPYCSVLAGRGTKHSGVGRCSHHAEDLHSGLAPWVGELTGEQVRRICGGRLPEGNTFPVVTGAGEGLLPFEQIMARRLEPEDLEVYRNAPVDAKTVVDANLRERWLAKDRIYRYLQRIRQRTAIAVRILRLEQADPETDKVRLSKIEGEINAIERFAEASIIEVEPALNKITGVTARLLEASARFRELEGQSQTRDVLVRALGALTDEDFAKMKSNPQALAHLVSSLNGG